MHIVDASGPRRHRCRAARCAGHDTAAVRFTVTAKGKAVTAWTHRSAKGANAVTLTRRLPNGKTLKAGAYTLSVGINASAKRSAAIRVR